MLIASKILFVLGATIFGMVLPGLCGEIGGAEPEDQGKLIGASTLSFLLLALSYVLR